MVMAGNLPPPGQVDNRRFLKYVSRATGAIILQNRTLRWSTPGTLNDPYDAQFDLHIDVDQQEVRAATLQKLWDAYAGDQPAPVGNVLGIAIRWLRERAPGMCREAFEHQFGAAIAEGLAQGERHLPIMQAEMRPIIAQSKVLCLTIVPDHPLMWAHYAEGHQGVALRFRSAPDLDSPWQMARPVEYRPNMPRLLDANFLADMMSGRAGIDAETIIHRLIFTKSAEWAYEQEWRIYSGAGRNPQAAFEDIPFHPRELDAAILGCRMSPDDLATFSGATRRNYPHAEILQVHQAERDYRFEIKPFGA